MGSCISVPFICIGVCANLEIKNMEAKGISTSLFSAGTPEKTSPTSSVVALELCSSGSLITPCSLLLGCCFKLNKAECLLGLGASGVFVDSAQGLAQADKPQMQMFRIICVCTFLLKYHQHLHHV